MMRVEVEIAVPGLDFSGEWRDLTGRAPPNAFMNPAAVAATRSTGYATTHLLLARDATPARTLVGVWALEEKKVSPLGPRFLCATPYFFAFESSPVIDARYTAEVARAFLDFLADHPHLPKVIRVKHLDGDAAAAPAIEAAVANRHSMILSERPRAFITRDGGSKRSGSTRKKLRQEWNRLSAAGNVDIVNVREPAAVAEAFETFLVLEKQSWKGANGTAILSSVRDGRFTRALVGNLAAERSASVALLRLDGKPIAAQVLLYCCRWAYTWKTAFDRAYEKHSPGSLLVDKITEVLFAAGDIDAIESCSPDGGFMLSLWPERRRTLDFLVDLGGRPSPTFMLVAMAVIGYGEAKAAGSRMRAWLKAARRATTPAAREAGKPA